MAPTIRQITDIVEQVKNLPDGYDLMNMGLPDSRWKPLGHGVSRAAWSEPEWDFVVKISALLEDTKSIYGVRQHNQETSEYERLKGTLYEHMIARIYWHGFAGQFALEFQEKLTMCGRFIDEEYGELRHLKYTYTKLGHTDGLQCGKDKDGNWKMFDLGL